MIHLACEGEVGAGNVAIGSILGIVGVVHGVAVVIHFEHGGATLCVNHAEVGFDVAGLLQRVEEVAELLHRSAELQGAVDDAAVGLASLFARLHLHQVVALCVHQGEARAVTAHPRLLQGGKVGAVDVGHKVVTLTLDVGHVVKAEVCVTVFPKQRTTVGGDLTRDNGRGAGPCFDCKAEADSGCQE